MLMENPPITIRLEHYLAQLTEWIEQGTIESYFSEIVGLYAHGYSVEDTGRFLAEVNRNGRRQ